MSEQVFASTIENDLALTELENARVAHQKYLIKQQEEDWNAAIEGYINAAKHNPELPEAYYRLAFLMWEKGEIDVDAAIANSGPEVDSKTEQAAKAAAEAQAAAQAEAIENSIRLAMAKSSVPRITVPITEFPPDVQQQYIEKHLGIKTTEEEIAKHELLHNEK